jgi:DNA-binding CsgD family transcriptional regulator
MTFSLPPIIGRDDVLEEFGRRLDSAGKRQGSAVFLIGEGGIGKSRLVHEVTNQALARGMCVMRGRGSAVGPAIPLRPLAEALQGFCRSGGPLSEGEVGLYAGILGWFIPDFAGPRGRHDDHKQGVPSVIAFAEAVLRLAATVGSEHGCLIVLEDLQDADAETLAAVEYLADNLDRQPTVLIGTMRADPCEALDVVDATAERTGATVITMAALARDEIRALAASRLGVKPQDIPGLLADRLWQDSLGNPYVAGELLHGMISKSRLVRYPNELRVAGEIRTEVPGTLIRGVIRRIDQLGPEGRTLLTVAAVVGRRFPLPVIQAVTKMGDANLLSCLQAATAAALVRADEPSPAWYSFTHPLTAQALLSQLTPAARAWYARQAAEAVETLRPGPADEWCQLAATLRLAGDDPMGACRVLATAGSQALEEGRLGSAVILLNRAWELTADTGEADLRADVLGTLLVALTETGQIGHALRLADQLDELDRAGLNRRRLAALLTRLGWVAGVAGRWADGLTHVKRARALFGQDAAEPDIAASDVVTAWLTLHTPDGKEGRLAETLARRAAPGSGEGGLPAVGCQAWLLLGILARAHDIGEATTCFERAQALACTYRQPVWRLRALFQLGVDEWLTEGHTTLLRKAQQEAEALGAISVGCDIDASIAFCHVLSGKYTMAASLIRSCRAEARRLRLGETERYVLMIQATLMAHQGRRQDMEKALAELTSLAGEQSRRFPLSLGLAGAFCALLEEDTGRARQELAAAVQHDGEQPSVYPLAGGHGLHVLLEVLAGRAGWPDYEKASASRASKLRWNRQFLIFARAVLLGHQGRPAEAAAAMIEAEHAAAPFDMALHLGLRLVAEAAATDGWGQPTVWLRRAEEYFHGASMSAPALACRNLLRLAGAPAPQRRYGVDRVPATLRELGITFREYEVLQLLASRPGNKAIAGRLHISPRTVEKHVASLILKTGQADRAALCEFAVASSGPGTAGDVRAGDRVPPSRYSPPGRPCSLSAGGTAPPGRRPAAGRVAVPGTGPARGAARG